MSNISTGTIFSKSTLAVHANIQITNFPFTIFVPGFITINNISCFGLKWKQNAQKIDNLVGPESR